MDQKAAYEMTIAEKLELLTVPDMVDAIWARIETQLDIDMPPDEGPADPPSTPPAGAGSWTRVVITIFAAALVTTIYFTNRKTNSNNDQAIAPDNTTTIITSPGNTNDKPPPARAILPLQQQIQPDGNAPLSLPPNQDSFSTVGDGAGIPVPDSVVTHPVLAPALPVILPADTSKKKGRGVRGIKDGDYRITPVKKDSA
jgi:hypothetical protein